MIDWMDLQTIAVACLGAMACALGGVLLVLRRMSLLADAISHSILLGIVLAWLVVRDLGSPWLLVGATGAGVFSVWLVEWLQGRAGVREDAAMGLVFPALFSLAVILVSAFAGSVHLDNDAVLNGRLEFAFLDPWQWGSWNMGPKSAWILGGLVTLQAFLIGLFFRPIQVAWFDPAFAASLGLVPAAFFWGATTVASLTCVCAFDAMGSILVVAMMVGPASSALLWVRRLDQVILCAVVFALASAVLGFLAGAWLDVSLAGMIAVATGFLFGLSWIFAPQEGWLARQVRKRTQVGEFRTALLVIHIHTHEDQPNGEEECKSETVGRHLKWDESTVAAITQGAVRRGYLIIQEGQLRTTLLGKEKVESLLGA